VIILPDGAKFEMSWKQVKYINHNDFIVFQIIPMFKDRDIIIVPSIKMWNKIESTFSVKEREEIIFLLERIDWKRDIKVICLDVVAQVNKELDRVDGSIENTEGYKTLTQANLFDTDSGIGKSEVRSIYLALEKKYTENIKGVVNIPRDTLIEGSVMNEFIIPILKKNKDTVVNLI